MMAFWLTLSRACLRTMDWPSLPVCSGGPPPSQMWIGTSSASWPRHRRLQNAHHQTGRVSHLPVWEPAQVWQLTASEELAWSAWCHHANLTPPSFMPFPVNSCYDSPRSKRIATESFPGIEKIVGLVFCRAFLPPTPLFVSKNSTSEQEVAKYPIASMYGIFTYIWLMVNVSKYTSPMDPMGMEVDNFFVGGMSPFLILAVSHKTTILQWMEMVKHQSFT